MSAAQFANERFGEHTIELRGCYSTGVFASAALGMGERIEIHVLVTYVAIRHSDVGRLGTGEGLDLHDKSSVENNSSNI